MWKDLLGFIFKSGNATFGLMGLAAIVTPLFMQKAETFCISYPVAGLIIVVIAVWGEFQRRHDPNGG